MASCVTEESLLAGLLATLANNPSLQSAAVCVRDQLNISILFLALALSGSGLVIWVVFEL